MTEQQQKQLEYPGSCHSKHIETFEQWFREFQKFEKKHGAYKELSHVLDTLVNLRSRMNEAEVALYRQPYMKVQVIVNDLVSSVERWPVYTKQEIKQELIDQLAEYNDDEIESGITLSVNCIVKDGNDLTPRYKVGLHTDGFGCREEVERCIEAGEIHWMGIHCDRIQVDCRLILNNFFEYGGE